MNILKHPMMTSDGFDSSVKKMAQGCIRGIQRILLSGEVERQWLN